MQFGLPKTLEKHACSHKPSGACSDASLGGRRDSALHMQQSLCMMQATVFVYASRYCVRCLVGPDMERKVDLHSICSPCEHCGCERISRVYMRGVEPFMGV